MMAKPERMMDALAYNSANHPNDVAIVCGEKNYTWAEYDKLTDTMAANLLKRGIKRGDKVALNAPNIPEWLIAYWALSKIGACVVALNVRFRKQELEYTLNQSDCVAMISIGLMKSPYGDFDFVEYLGGLRGAFPDVAQYFFIGGVGESGFSGAIDFAELLKEPSKEDAQALNMAKGKVVGDDPMVIIFTSGTTGKPKGAVITQKSQIECAYAEAIHLKADSNDSMVVAQPLNHVAGITCAVVALMLSGGKVILQPFFVPSQHIDLLKQHQPTFFGGVTTMIVYVFKDPTFTPDAVKGARLALTGGSNVEPELMEQMLTYLPHCKMVNLYGLSECSGGVILSTFDDDRELLLSSIGKPLPGHEVKIVDGEGSFLPPGEIGELVLTGGSVGAGYYNMAHETAETFRPFGLMTGDMGYVDQRGYVFLKGRKKEMYIQGGYNIYPAEIENALTSHPDVVMAAGIGVPHAELGEVGRVYVVPAPDSVIDQGVLVDYLKQHIANYKIPRQFVFVDDLPMTPTGKVAKAQIKQEYMAAGA